MKRYFLVLIFILQTMIVCAKEIDIEQYHAHSSIQWSWAISSLCDLAINENEAILDLGSADGKITAYLATRASKGSVIGLDSSAVACEFSKMAFPHSSYPCLNFINDDATQFSSPETFDLITAFCTLNWIDQKELAFLRMAENLKKGGRALIVVPCDAKDTEHLYELYAKRAGLEILYSKKERKEIVFQSTDEFKEWLRALLADLPQEQFNVFFERHLDTVQKMYPQAGDGRLYAFPYKLTLLLKKT